MPLPSGPKPPDEIYVLVHATAGSRNYYWRPRDIELPVLDRVLAAPLPAAYGVIPATHHTDGEPLDALVLVSEPPLPGTLLPARPIGLARLVGEQRLDDKIIAVCAVDSSFAGIKDITDLPRHQLRDLAAALRTDWAQRVEWWGAKRALRAVSHAFELYRRQFGG